MSSVTTKPTARFIILQAHVLPGLYINQRFCCFVVFIQHTFDFTQQQSCSSLQQVVLGVWAHAADAYKRRFTESKLSTELKILKKIAFL